MEPQAPAAPEQQSRKPHGLGTLLFVPVLYGLGWLTARPLQWLVPDLRPDQLDLAGLVVALLLLLFSLPWRLRRSWGAAHPWRRLGVVAPPLVAARTFLGGLAKAALLLASGKAVWQLDLKAGELLNALALLLGVGFAEELLFRGWLWGELGLQLSRRRALLLQAALFALVHPWYRAGNPGAIGLLGGLILLGLALALQRRSDGGVLWGSDRPAWRPGGRLVRAADRAAATGAQRAGLAGGTRGRGAQSGRWRDRLAGAGPGAAPLPAGMDGPAAKHDHDRLPLTRAGCL